MKRPLAAALSLFGLAGFGLTGAALAADAAYRPLPPRTATVVFAGIPYCDDKGVLDRMVDRFGWAERETWKTGLAIQALGEFGEAGHRPNQSLTERRYCHARAIVSNGHKTHVFYLIEGNQGFAGVGWNVTFCLPDYDRWHVYDASCRTVKP